MGVIATLGRIAWRRYVIDNVPASGPQRPDKGDITAFVDAVDGAVVDLQSSFLVPSLIKATWAALAAITATTDGQRGEVTGTDAGTHTDPVVGGSVPNEGIYSWSASPAGWRRVSNRDTAQSVRDDLGVNPAGPGVAPTAFSQLTTINSEITALGPTVTGLRGDLGTNPAGLGVAPTAFSQLATLNATTDALNDKLAFAGTGEAPTVLRNGVRDRFGPDGAPVSKRRWEASSTAKLFYSYQSAVFAQDGARSVIKSIGPVAANFEPRVSVFVSPGDLARLGVNPNDTTPPLISVKGSIVKALAGQHTLGSVQVWLQLRYAATNRIAPDVDPTTDVILINANAGSSYGLGIGDSLWNHGSQVINDAVKTGFKFTSVKVPATYGGHPFVGLVISAFGSSAGATPPVIFGVTDFGVVAGSSISAGDTLLNEPEDLAKADYNAAAVVQGGHITIQNSDKIAFLGDSYTQSLFTMKDKSYIQRVSELTDWRMENYGRAGDDLSQINQRVLNNTPQYHATLGFQDYGATYALLVSFTNDWRTRSTRLSYFIDDMRRLAKTVQARGAKPIIATEFVPALGVEAAAIAGVAAEIGAKFIDIAGSAQIFNQTRYDGYFGEGHPGARTNWLMAAPLIAEINALPRPRQAIKMYRHRPGHTMPNGLDDLLFDTIAQRARIWQELSIGHQALAPNLAPYYDHLPDVDASHGGFVTPTVNSEYLTLQADGLDVASLFYLVEVILPTSRPSRVVLNIGEGTASVYVPDRLAAIPAFDAYAYGNLLVAFFFASAPSIAAGATYGNGTDTFTIVGAVTTPEGENVVLANWTSGEFASYLKYSDAGSGSLTKSSGGGAATLNYTEVHSGRQAGYYAALYKPRGTLVEVSNDGGTIDLSGSRLQNAMDYDKLIIVLAVHVASRFRDVSVDWYGIPEDKSRATPAVQKPLRGTQLLTATKFASLTGWTSIGTITSQDPSDGILPFGCTKIVKVTAANHIRQSFTVTADSDYPSEVEIRAWARRNPLRFDPSSSESTAAAQYATAPITSSTYDYATLAFNIDQGDTRVVMRHDEIIGLHWHEVRFRLQVPNAQMWSGSSFVELFSPDDTVELALVEVRQP